MTHWGISCSSAFLKYSLLLGHHEANSFSLSCPSCRMVLPHHRLKAVEDDLKSPMSPASTDLSSFRLRWQIFCHSNGKMSSTDLPPPPPSLEFLRSFSTQQADQGMKEVQGICNTNVIALRTKPRQLTWHHFLLSPTILHPTPIDSVDLINQ